MILSYGTAIIDPQNEEKHGQQAARHVEQDDINVLDPDKSSPFPKDRLSHPIKRLRLVKLKLPELDLQRMQMRGRGCWLGMTLHRLEVELGLLIRECLECYVTERLMSFFDERTRCTTRCTRRECWLYEDEGFDGMSMIL